MSARPLPIDWGTVPSLTYRGWSERFMIERSRGLRLISRISIAMFSTCSHDRNASRTFYQTSLLVVWRLLAFLQTRQRQARVALGLFVAGLRDLLDGPHQRLNGTLQIFRVHLVRFVARKVDADQHDIASIAEAVGRLRA